LDKLTIIGTGLIGGSVGARLRLAPARPTITGFDRDPHALRDALALGVIDLAAATAAESVAGAEAVLVATPVDHIGSVFESIAGALAAGAVVTDTGSAKAGVVAAGEAVLGPRFVGGHPMAGSERHGVGAAEPDLFEDAWWILTPTERTAPDAYRTAAALVASVGAKPIAVEPTAHDSLIARLSHLPQLVSSAVVQVAAADEPQESLLGLAAGGFRDVTRIAASDPDLWVSIIRANAKAVLEALDGLGSSLGRLRSAIDEGQWDDLRGFLAGARDARLELFAKAVYTGAPVALTLLIPDRPGVLAEVTREAGELGVNIEDLQIFHSTEGGRGRLELVVAGREAGERLLGRLEALGYHVEMGLPDR
jgi:prephenate dehydrogenase